MDNWCNTVCVDGHSTVLDWTILLGLFPAIIIVVTVAVIVTEWRRKRHG